MRSFTVMLGALLLPCALGAQDVSREPLLVRMSGYLHHVRLDTMIVWHTVNAPADVAFRGALAALADMQIPVGKADSARGRIHHAGFGARVRLMGEPMSRMFRCGSGLAGDYADSWRINIAYAVYVRPEGDGSSIGISVVAGARDMDGASKPPTPCASTGAFGRRLANAIELRS